MSKHTPGPWSVTDETDIVGIENDPANGCVGPVDVAHVYLRTVPGRTNANARRIVACVNACDGIETYALELMTGHLSIKEQITATGKQKPKQTSKTIEYRRQRDELLEALVDLVAFYPPDSTDAVVTSARAAIAKVTGEQP